MHLLPDIPSQIFLKSDKFIWRDCVWYGTQWNMQDKDVIIESLLKRIDGLQQHSLAAIEREQQKDKLIEEQAAIILQLQERIARLEKNSSTSSKPPSSDITNPPLPKGKKKKRKRGGQRGHDKHTRKSFATDEIDETIIHKLSDAEVERRGLIELPQTEMALQQVSLPDKLYRVTEHHVQLYPTEMATKSKRFFRRRFASVGCSVLI